MGGGEGVEDNSVLCSTFLVSALFQDMLLHDVCTGRGGGGGEDSNVLCSTHTESHTNPLFVGAEVKYPETPISLN